MDAQRIRGMVERLLADIFADTVPGLRKELTWRVLEHLKPALMQLASAASAEQLDAALAALQFARSESDALRALLETTSICCARIAVFILNGGKVAGWHSRGFRQNENVKLPDIDAGAGLAGQALHQRRPVAGPATQFEPSFAIAFGPPFDGRCIVAPLLVSEQAMALVYADAGSRPDGRLDAVTLHTLVREVGVCIELLILRRLAGASAGTHAAPSSVPLAPARPAAASGSQAVQPVPPAAVPAAHPAAPPAAGQEEEEMHRRARRFARLLVDEIRLYNKARVEEGRRNRDLYARLREVIEKSRATYDKRYANTPVAASRYFDEELLSNLADNDRELLGAGFSH